MNTLYSYKNRNSKLWKIFNSNIEIKKEDILDQQILKTKSNTDNSFILKKFILTKNYLLYLKNKKIKGYVVLNNIGIEVSEDEKKISLFNDDKYFGLFFENIDILKKWKKILKKQCIFNNLHNKFNLVKKIGQGGSAQVFLAKKIKNDKEYAIKIISKENFENNEDDEDEDQINNLSSLLNEIKILRELNHKNIIKFYYLYESKSNFYLVFEYCNFQTWTKYVKNISNSEKKKITIELLDAVDYLHSLNLVHRDLKPDNILCHKNENGEISLKIIDFGLSNFLDEDFIYKKCGTPGYISPEILKSKDDEEFIICRKSDIYSLGHIIHFIYLNLGIYEYDNVDELIEKNKFNNYKLSKKIDKNLKKIIQFCLEKKPSNRIDLETLKILILNLNKE